MNNICVYSVPRASIKSGCVLFSFCCSHSLAITNLKQDIRLQGSFAASRRTYVASKQASILLFSAQTFDGAVHRRLVLVHDCHASRLCESWKHAHECRAKNPTKFSTALQVNGFRCWHTRLMKFCCHCMVICRKSVELPARGEFATCPFIVCLYSVKEPGTGVSPDASRPV